LFAAIFKALGGAALVSFRLVRSNLMRLTTGVRSRAKRATRVSRGATKLVNNATKNLSQIGQRPTKREDFIETKHSYISKSFLLLVFLVLLCLAALAYFVVIPLAMRFFFTARIQKDNSKLADYTGKVIIFYDKEKDMPYTVGYLKDGKLEGNVKQYNEDGELIFEGTYSAGKRTGEGKEYENGMLIYEGSFQNGDYSGKGKQYEDSILVFSGTFEDGKRSGDDCCTYYSNGVPSYRGAFVRNEQTGEGASYYENGALQYVGSFSKGIWSGEGTFYNDEGKIVYVGAFSENLFNGDGSIYLSDGFRLDGSFTDGVQNGTVQISRSGVAYYMGSATNCEAHGQGNVYDRLGNLLYSGTMRGSTIDGSCLLGMTMDEVKAALGDSRYTETEKSDGILLETNELGLSVYFSYSWDDDSEPIAFDVSIARNIGYDDVLDSFLWGFSDDLDGWRETLWPNAPMVAGKTVPKYSGARYGNQSYSCVIYSDGYNDSTIWMTNGDCFMLQWTVAQGQIATGDSGSVLDLPEDVAALIGQVEGLTAEIADTEAADADIAAYED